MSEAIEKIWKWAYKCTCQREKCGHVWITFKDPNKLKCPKCWFLHWQYKSGGPFLNGDKEDGRKNGKRWAGKKKGGVPGDVLPGPTT